MAKTISGLDPAAFKTSVNGKLIDLFILTNSSGAEAVFSNYGGTLISFVVPDKSGKPTDIVLGLPTIAAYMAEETYLGSTIGPYSNRIARGKFTIDGKEHSLPTNNGPNNLHSGPTGFHTQIFDVASKTANSILFSIVSPDGFGGLPGTLQAAIRYTLTDGNALVMDTTATTDAPTVASITNHAFFNLDGGNCDATPTVLQINADWYLPTDATNIPFGSVLPVAGTNFDFTTPIAIGARINDESDEQLKVGAGYDHTWVITNASAGALVTAARAFSEKSGIVLEVKTTLPGVQLYSGNWLSGLPGKIEGVVNARRFAFCLEPQYFPDSPNRAHFPSPVLRPLQQYHHLVVFQVSILA